MKSNWQTKKLGEICEIEYGTRVVHKRDGGSVYPVYGGGGKTFFMDNYNRENRVVIARFAMSERCTRFIDGKFFLNDSGLTISPKNNKELIQEFLNWLIISLNEKIYSLGRGSAQRNLNVDLFRDLKISFPSVSEQKRIVKILDEAFEKLDQIKENTEKNLKNSKELFESYLNNIFSNPEKDWEVKTLDKISDNLDSKRIPITKRNRETGKYPYYGASGIVDHVSNYIFDDKLLLISEDGANLLDRNYPIAFSSKGKIWVNNHAHVVRFKNLFTQKFVEYYLNYIKINKYVSGAAQPKLNQNKLNSIPIPYPTQNKQKQIIQKLDQLSEKTKELEEIYKKKLENIEELKKSILKKAFNGEL